MDRERFILSDTVWEKIEALLPGKKSDRGVTAKDNRLFLEAVLWRVRAGLRLRFRSQRAWFIRGRDRNGMATKSLR